MKRVGTVRWCDLDELAKVCRVQDGVLTVWGESYGTMTALLQDGVLLPCEVAIGTWLRLQNVCIRGEGSMEIAANSRVTVVASPFPTKHEDKVLDEPPAPSSPSPLRSKFKWKCATCGYTNFPSKSVCYKCNKT